MMTPLLAQALASPSVDLHAIAPEIAITVALLAVLAIDLFLPDRLRPLNGLIAMAGVTGAAISLATLIGEPRTTFSGMFVLDSYALLFKFLFVAVTAIIILMSMTYLNEVVRSIQGEFYFLLLTAMLGMLVLASGRDLIVLFVALETLSIPGFIIAGFKKKDAKSNEAAIKFFLFGVLSAAVMLFGMSMIYGFTGSTNLATISEQLKAHADNPLVAASILLIIVGFAFKISAVPFHFWAPDTYEGSPLPVAAFLSVGSKAAGFAGLLAICFGAFGDFTRVWAPGFAIMAALTMTLGNVTALAQKNIVRLFAYSSIAQSGYILLPLGVVAGQSASVQRDAFAASLTYILIYAFMNMGAFAVVIAVGRRHEGNAIADYEGLGAREPGLAFAMMFFLLSLAGMVPSAGFWAKFFVFRSAIGAGTIWLASLMVLNTIVGLYYYIKVGASMYLRQPVTTDRIGVPYPLKVAVVLTAVVVAALTIYPEFFNHFTPNATLVAGL